jgi:adenylate cyclase
MTRRLAAILASDIVGYTSLISADEAGTLSALKTHRTEVFNPRVEEHGGRIVKLMGDGALVEFPSVSNAVLAALSIQRDLAESTGPIRLRIGVNLGDIVLDGEDIYGEGVNIAARLEALADPGGICISSVVHDSLGRTTSEEFQDAGEHQLKGLSRRVRIWRWPCGPKELRRVAGASAAPDKPSIAVLPFVNMSGDPEQEFFSDGITEDINTELSRYDELLVIARNSTVAYKNAVPDNPRIAAELGVRHILTGSVRRSGSRVRIAAQLSDTETGTHIWADRFDRDIEDIFAVQDEITAVIVNALLGKLKHKEYQRSLHKRPETLDAYDHALRASVLMTDWDREKNFKARPEAELAIGLDPKFARAHALQAWTYSLEAVLRWVEDPDRSFKEGYAAAIMAVDLDYDEPWAHAALGFSELWGRREYVNGIDSLQRAISLNPNNPHFRIWLSNGLCLAGRSEEGLIEYEKAIRLNPNFPPIYLHFRARILATLGRHAEALSDLERLVKVMPTSTNSLALLAACNAALGRVDEAKLAIARLLEVSPDFRLAVVPSASPYALKEDLDSYLELLRKAGLPE